MHGADCFCGLDFGERFAGIEILGHAFDFVQQFFGSCQVVDFQRSQKLVGFLRVFQGAPFRLPRQQANAGHVFTECKSLGQPLSGTLQFTLLQQKLVGLDSFVDVADRFIGEAVDLAE